MRITGGELRGRILKVPAAGHVRPTQDAVREALFSILMAEVPGSRFLDLYAGSGAVGIEAWSRGAAEVTWVESHPGVARVLAANVGTLCGGAGRIVREDALRWIARARPGDAPYAVIFADPPYGDDQHADPIEALMVALAASPLAAEGTIFVAEQRAGLPMPKAEGWARIKDRRYGHTRLAIFTRNPPKPADEESDKNPEHAPTAKSSAEEESPAQESQVPILK